MDIEEHKITIVRDENCRWCRGRGMIPVPMYDMIREFGAEQDVLNKRPTFQMKGAVYCHRCYPETPIARGNRRYANLLNHIDRFADDGWKKNLLVAVLEQNFENLNDVMTPEDDHELQALLYRGSEPAKHYYESQSSIDNW